MGGPGEVVDVPNIRVEWRDVEIAHQSQRRLGFVINPLGCRSSQPIKPLKLVCVVRVVEGATVWHVKAPESNAVERCPQRAGLGHIFELGHIGKANFNVGGRYAASKGNAVPLVEAVNLEVVAGSLESFARKLLWLALDLLHGQHIDVGSHHPVDHAIYAGSDGVDVVGGDSHEIRLSEVCP